MWRGAHVDFQQLHRPKVPARAFMILDGLEVMQVIVIQANSFNAVVPDSNSALA